MTAPLLLAWYTPLRMFTVSRDFRFEAAHFLPKYFGKCENLHGHSYRLRVTLRIAQLDENGISFDFVRLGDIVKKEIVSVLDHRLVNDFIPLASAEHMAMWTWGRLEKHFDGALFEINVWETEKSFVTFRGKHGTF